MKISLFYEHVTVLDYAYLDEHLGVVGNSLIVNVEFIGKTDNEGVIFDFSKAKKKVKEIIDDECDHRLVIPQKLANINGNRMTFEYHYGHDDKKISYDSPLEGVCQIPYAHVSQENLKSYLENLVLAQMPETVVAIKLSFKEEVLSDKESFFHYTHGLKQHYGNCQRLLHGHRSTIKVFINDQRDYELEARFSREFFGGNIHFCLWENVKNKEEIQDIVKKSDIEGRYPQIPSVRIGYVGNQGEFSCTLPGDEVYFMQEETTVENLSVHFTKLTKSLHPNSRVCVYAYEGIAKGAKTTL